MPLITINLLQFGKMMSINVMKTFKLSVLATSLAAGLSACGGDDGENGQVGSEGAQG